MVTRSINDIRAITNSSDLANNLTDETGTGVVVFNNSPTLITPTITLANNAFLNGNRVAGTATGLIKMDASDKTQIGSTSTPTAITIDLDKVGIGTTAPGSKLDVAGAIKTAGYTVATLPSLSAGARAYVTDATAPTFLGTLTGGGAVVCPVFHNGATWVST